ncbi:ATPases involved in chromosome partitioning [Pyrobaculum oguniense TE7]|uniref:ATPases involved in chromosome partitioning n=1 Tax=Pyrobaculum oguniense (strain DSM 13380 / JCM 10595 / TE7) TaxID=698757 RepID=H6Q975_PYROT|nr:ATPases involved in chromosome partitioning [Pyrobaculum oguniense TE7]
MHTISFVSASGGAGKTLFSILTAGALAIRGKKVLLIDMDPSASATLYLLDKYVEDCNLQTLLKNLVDYKLGRAARRADVNDCLARHRVAGAEASSFDLLPGGNLSDIQSEVFQVSGWNRLMADLVAPIESGYDYVIVDSPNWLFPLFPMTVSLSSLYVVMTRPGKSEIEKTKVFLQRVFAIMDRQFGIAQPQIYALVVLNQIRQNAQPDEVEREGKAAYDGLSREFPGIKFAYSDKKAKYYGEKKESAFWGFKYYEDLRLDSYKQNGHVLASSKVREEKPKLQFRAYLELFTKFVEETAVYERLVE